MGTEVPNHENGHSLDAVDSVEGGAVRAIKIATGAEHCLVIDDEQRVHCPKNKTQTPNTGSSVPFDATKPSCISSFLHVLQETHF